jgi:fatty-acyl-CoA synthase
MSQLTEHLARASTGRGGVTVAATGERRGWPAIRDQALRRRFGLQETAGGRTLGLLGEPSFELLEAVYGCIVAGVPFAILQPPSRGELPSTYEHRLAAHIRQADCAALILTDARSDAERPKDQAVPIMEMLVLPVEAKLGRQTDSCGDDNILVQHFSSGTTRTPRCVPLTHKNVFAGCQATMTASDHSAIHQVLLSWLPLSHDMGLFGFLVISMLCGGCELVLDSPKRFIANPKTWLADIQRFEATTIAAPNFAYGLAAKLLRTGLTYRMDSLRCCLTGGERVTQDAMVNFSQASLEHGLRRGTQVIAYGLAEATLAVTMTELGRPLSFNPVDAKEQTQLIASCGSPVPGMEVRTARHAGPETLLVRGAAVCAAAADTSDGWLDTGDIAYLRDGEVFVTGRFKNLIIRAGRNYFPEDFEHHAAALPWIRAGGVAAVGHPGPSGTDLVSIFVETDEDEPPASWPAELRDHLRKTVGVSIDEVVFLPRRSIPKTTSGKIQHQSLLSARQS